MTSDRTTALPGLGDIGAPYGEPAPAPEPGGRRRAGGKVLAYTALSLLAAVALVPFVWTVSSSLKSIDTIFNNPTQVIPPDPQWSNYSRLWNELPLSRWLSRGARCR